MKKVLENAILLIIAAALFIGFYSYIKLDKGPTIKDEIVDVETEEVELYKLTIYCSEMDDIIIQYEEGMTWGEWLGSQYNTYGFYSENNWICLHDYMLLKLSNHSTVEKNNSIIDEAYILNPMPEEVELYELTIDCSEAGIDDIIIQYEEGMTWREWINSEYNTYGFSTRFNSTGMSGFYYVILDENSLSNGQQLVFPEFLIEPVTYYLLDH